MNDIATWVTGISIVIVSIYFARKTHLLEKLKFDKSRSKTLLIEVAHAPKFGGLANGKPFNSGYEISIKLVNSGSNRIVLSKLKLVDELENELLSITIPDLSRIVDFDKPVNISRTILENNPVLSKISSNSFRVLIKDADGKTYFGRP